MMYRGLQSGKTNDAAMRLAELARNYTSIKIEVVSEEMLKLKKRAAKLEQVAEAARDAAIQMHCMCRPHKICEKCDLLKELEKLEGEG